MPDFKKTKKTVATRGLVSTSAKVVFPKAYDSGRVVAQSAKTGRFAEGVKIVAKRDRNGLIKLADR
jgi:hypothetical protein